MAIVFSIDKFMSENRALTNFIGNGVATIVVSAWEGELDRDKLERRLGRRLGFGRDPARGGGRISATRRRAELIRASLKQTVFLPRIGIVACIGEKDMHTRRLFLAVLGLAAFNLTALAATGARAFEIQPYKNAAAQSAIASGKPVVLEVYASWCPICHAQASAIDAIKNKPEFKDITFFRVDYDAQKDVARKLKSPRATLIVYRGGKEVARESWGATNEDVTKILMQAAS